MIFPYDLFLVIRDKQYGLVALIVLWGSIGKIVDMFHDSIVLYTEKTVAYEVVQCAYWISCRTMSEWFFLKPIWADLFFGFPWYTVGAAKYSSIWGKVGPLSIECSMHIADLASQYFCFEASWNSQTILRASLATMMYFNLPKGSHQMAMTTYSF